MRQTVSPSVLDLTGESSLDFGVLGSSPPTLSPAVYVARERTYQIDALVRSLIALILSALFGLTIVFAFLQTDDAHWANTKELLSVLLPAQTGILGAAIGYYFGTKDRSERSRRNDPTE
jgi:hypothetical protein